MSNTQYSFEKLTPISDSDLGIYENALDYVFNNDDIKNVAVSGAYGAGKSSILESYKAKHKNKNYLHISLAYFSENQTTGIDDTIKESVLEGKILNQLIHQIDSDKIPQTKFKVKKAIKHSRTVLATAVMLLFAITTFVFIFFENWRNLVNNIELEWLKRALGFSTTTIARIITGIIAIALAAVIIYRLIELQKNKGVFRKLSVQGNEIEILEESDESYFDKYLNEVLYLFDNVDADVIVFEDMDRFDANRIFERLREVNTLTNQQRKNDGKKVLRFFYLLRDDLFVSKDRTKFFDYIIPVVPVMDSSNSYDQFIAHLKKNDLYEKFDVSFLQGISLYVDDMRLLKNICNEFLVYYNRLNTTELDYNKMLAMITYKNLFPRDYSDLQLNKGFVYSLFQQKDDIIRSEDARIDERIKSLTSDIENINNEHLKTIQELEIISKHKESAANGYYGYGQARTEYQRWLKEECPERKKLIEAKTQQKTQQIKKTIKELQEQSEIIKTKRLKQLITRENIDEIFSVETKDGIGNIEQYHDVKGNDYFPLLKYLIRNGYIDETYPDYMTYFYENSLNKMDKVFLRSVTDKKAKEYSYKLHNPKMVFDRLRVVDFEQEETLNNNLFDYLILHKQETEQAVRFIMQLKSTGKIDFIEQYSEVTASTPGLIGLLTKFWPEFFAEVIQNDKTTTRKIKWFIVGLLYFATREAIEAANNDGVIREHIQSSPGFLEIEDPRIDKLIDGFKILSVSFPAIDYEKSNKALLNAVYKNGLYQINYANIEMILLRVIGIEDEAMLRLRCCSLALSDTNLPLAKKANEDMDTFMGVVLSECDDRITDDQFIAIKILNDESVSGDKKLKYIGHLSTKLEELGRIKDKELWSPLVSYGIVEVTEKNISDYYNNAGALDDTIIDLINTALPDYLDFNSYEKDSSTDLGGLLNAFVQCEKLDNQVYTSIVASFRKVYSKFIFDDISAQKMEILISNSIIQMNQNNLMFLRDMYPDQRNLFIEHNIEAYVQLMDTSLFDHDELVSVLSMNIDDEYKLALLGFDKSPVSISDIICSAKILNHILNNNLDDDDLPELFSSYSTFEDEVQKTILQLAEDCIDEVISISTAADQALIDDLLRSDHIDKSARIELLITNIPSLGTKETAEYLTLLGKESFVKIFDSTTRPRFDATQQNISLLDAFVAKGWIHEYYQGDDDNLRIRRHAPRN